MVLEDYQERSRSIVMALEINHETNDIVNSTGQVKFNGVAVGGDNGPANSGTRGIFGGGSRGSYSNIMDYITISTTGNATDFGDLTVARRNCAACSNGTRGVWAGGYSSSDGYHPVAGNDAFGHEEMDYVTFASTGNATDFGNLSDPRFLFGGCSDGSRGVFGGGQIKNEATGTVGGSSAFARQNAARDTIDYITIATTANSTDFGDLVDDEPYGESAC